MKLSDKKFLGSTGNKTASQKPGVDKQALKVALNSSVATGDLFDKIAQLANGGLMAPAMGQVQPQPRKKLTPIHEGMWDPRQLKKHYRKLRSMGYGINDADMAVSDVIREGGAGAGADDERVKDFLKRLWYATISTKPHEEALYRLASNFSHPLEKIAGAILAGGAVRNFIGGFGAPRDYDYFFDSQEAREEAIAHLEQAGAKVHARNASGGVIFKLNDTLIDVTPVIGEPRDVLAGFDITANKCYAIRNSVYALESATDAIKTKTIKLANVHFPTSTLKRVESLGERYGFMIEQSDLDSLKARASTELSRTAQLASGGLTPSTAVNVTPSQMKALGIVPSGAPCPHTGYYNCVDPSCPEVSGNAPSGAPCPHTGLHNCTDPSCPLFDDGGAKIEVKSPSIDVKCECGVDKIGGGMHSDWCPKAALNVRAGLSGDTLSSEEIEGTGKIAEEIEAQAMPGAPGPSMPAGDSMPMPPAGGEPAAPAPAPEEMMGDEEEMSLEEAIQQLEEASAVVVEKVNAGEALDSSGQNLVPEPPMDTGATPSPAPKLAQTDYDPDLAQRLRDLKKKNPSLYGGPPQIDRGGPSAPKKPEEKMLPLKKLDTPEHVYDADGNIVKTIVERTEFPKAEPKAPAGPRPDPMVDISKQYGDDVAKLLKMKEEARDLFKTYSDKVDPAVAHKVLRSMGDFGGLSHNEFMSAYDAMKAADEKAKARKQGPMGPGRSQKPMRDPVNPGALKDMSKAEVRKLIDDNMAKMRQRLEKKSVDQDAKDYWTELFGEYGDLLTKDRVASVVDFAEEIFDAHGFKPAKDVFNRIVAFVADANNTKHASLFGAVSELARRDEKFASVVDRIMLTYIAKSANTFSTLPDSSKPEFFVMAAHAADATDSIMTYVAQKMKIPSVKGQPDDAVDIDEMHDMADKSEQTKQIAHIPMELDSSEFRGGYLHMTISWEKDSPAADGKSDEALMQAVTSFVKGLESQKEFKDLGFLGQINFSEFDSGAGVADVYVRTNKGGDAVQVVKTE